MRASIFPDASRLGFGCASLGSRVGRREGLRGLARAFELGINWFDLAPSYGDGEAEAIFADFGKERRDSIHICTKFGLASARLVPLARLAKPMARRALRLFPQARQLLSRYRRGASATTISAGALRRSLDASLLRLQTDHVDVYALHDPAPDDLAREELQRAIEDILTSGKARIVGVAGSLDAAMTARRIKLPANFIQIGDPPFQSVLERLRAATGPDWPAVLVTHSVFGQGDAIAMLTARAGSRAQLQQLLTAYGYTTPLRQAAKAALLDLALARNPGGIVLTSMFSRGHVERNAAVAKMATPDRARQFFDTLARVGSSEQMFAKRWTTSTIG